MKKLFKVNAMSRKLLAALACLALFMGCASSSEDTTKKDEKTEETKKDKDSSSENEELTSDTPSVITPETESESKAENSDTISVAEAIANQDQYVKDGTVVNIEGYLPQSVRVDDAGNSFIDIQESTDSSSPDEWIRLSAENLDFGGCKAVLTGTLSIDGNGNLVLNVTKAVQIN